MGNLLFLDFVFVSQGSQSSDLSVKMEKLNDSFKILSNQVHLTSFSDVATAPAQITNSACPTSCMTAFNTALANIKTGGGATTVVNRTTTVNQKGEYVIPLGSGVVASVGQWNDAYTAQGSFDTANFGSIKAFYFEALMHSPEGEIKAKLYDDTTPFSYDGQVLTTSSNTGQLLSIQMPLIYGKKSYHVKLYSTISLSASLDSAKIRIVTN